LQNSKESFWAKNASKYDSSQNTSIECLIERISNNIDSSDSVLDVAAGTGKAALTLAKHAHHVDAIDSEPKMLAVAKGKMNVEKIDNISLHKQNAYELEFPNDSFDSVVILNSLHVMETPHLALKEAKRVIKAKGLLFAPTYCHAQTREVQDNYEKWSLLSGHKSYHLFTCETLCDLISSCGFSIREKEIVYIDHGGENGVMVVGYIVAIPNS
jgi:ubiquinone/menaquinone biosynthesis C-methylase UbiE